MLAYAARRLGYGLVLAVLVTAITFFLLSPSHESVARSVVGPTANAETVAAKRSELGFDRPVIVQYADWLGGAVRGDLGRSLFTAEPVASAITARLAVTLSIIVVALTLTIVVSVALGVWAASRGGAVDRLAQGVSLFGHVVPSLLIAIALVLVLAIRLRWLPATGFTPIGQDVGRWAASITIPVVVLVTAGIADLTQQVRGAMIDELNKDYVRTLRARGVASRTIVLKNALRCASGPALTVLSLAFISMFGGILVIERIFVLPGFGTYSLNASMRGDIPAIMGVITFSALLVVIVNLITDLVNGWLNPKARIY